MNRTIMTYTGMMVLGMALSMLSYNAALTAGFTTEALQIVAIGFVPTFILAFIIEQFVVSHNVHKLHKILVFSDDHQFKHILVMALLFVTFMTVIMSLYGTLISTSTEDRFAYHYFLNFVRNWPVALFVQLVVVGPLVRLIHIRLFSPTKLVE